MSSLETSVHLVCFHSVKERQREREREGGKNRCREFSLLSILTFLDPLCVCLQHIRAIKSRDHTFKRAERCRGRVKAGDCSGPRTGGKDGSDPWMLKVSEVLISQLAVACCYVYYSGSETFSCQGPPNWYIYVFRHRPPSENMLCQGLQEAKNSPNIKG